MYSVILGIDPGKSGALAAMYMHDKNEIYRVQIIPFEEMAYRDLLAECADSRVICCLEKVSAMPGQGVVSMFNFGHNLGFIEGLLQAFKIPYQVVRPQVWKKEFSLNSDKQTSIDMCKKLFPGINLLATPRSRKENDGMAEALLLAEYARRKL